MTDDEAGLPPFPHRIALVVCFVGAVLLFFAGPIGQGSVTFNESEYDDWEDVDVKPDPGYESPWLAWIPDAIQLALLGLIGAVAFVGTAYNIYHWYTSD